ncbi:C-type lectin receptor-like tyrosine-protein kinase [Forsythia ovata]|uniref:C-type lectin receptor-like tyrosine-protein kinase n=1 Tax=Forsythia ovata TaxID=205694 RepID=A0ABD1QCR3_9LAMI
MEFKLPITIELPLLLLVSCLLFRLGASNSGFNESLDVHLTASSENQTHQEASCPSGWISNPSNTKCFKYIANNQSWDESETHCKANNGHLAAVTSLQELSFIQKLCSENASGCWVGGRGINGKDGLGWKWSEDILLG